MSMNEQATMLDSISAELSPSLSARLDRWRPLRSDWAGPLQVGSPAEIAGLIDHTLLRPTATPAEIDRLCSEAASWKFKSVCVNPCHVARASALLRGSGVLCCTVVGFPLGATTPQDKAGETARAIADGADEIDMVINQGLAIAGDWDLVQDDIGAVVDAAAGRTVKVIIETCNLDRIAKTGACLCSALAGAHFVKTSTGFGSAGANVDDVALMRLLVGGGMHVKASGGIRTTADAMSMIGAGADRIGASASIAIIGR